MVRQRWPWPTELVEELLSEGAFSAACFCRTDSCHNSVAGSTGLALKLAKPVCATFALTENQHRSHCSSDRWQTA